MVRRWRAAIKTQSDVKLEQSPPKAACNTTAVRTAQRRKRERKGSRTKDTGTRCVKVHLRTPVQPERYGRTASLTGCPEERRAALPVQGRCVVDAIATYSGALEAGKPAACRTHAMLVTDQQRGTSMDIMWPLIGINAIFLGLGWRMERGARQQRRQNITRRSSVVASQQKAQPPHVLASHPAELHCPHCGHIIGDRDFARQHAPTVDWTGRASQYFRQPPI